MAKENEFKIPEETTVEEAFQQLQGLLTAMEADDATLEDTFRSYEQGMQLVKFCNDKIDGVEKKVQKMNADGSLSDFDNE